MFNQQELQRYSRQIRLPELGLKGQDKLKKSSVLVIGAGGLGCPILLYLTAAGVGNIGIVDGDVVGWSNLHRQILFNENNIGKKKVLIAKKVLSKINSSISITPIDTYLDNDNILDIMKAYDVVVDGTDNFASRYRINDACVILKKPLVYGALSKFQGQAGVFNYEGSGTYRCVFPTPPLPENAPNCDEIGIIGVIPGIIGNLQALETLKIITGIGQPLVNQLFLIDTLSNQYYTINYHSSRENLQITKLKKNYENFCNANRNENIQEHEIDANTLKNSEINKYNIIDIRPQASFETKNIGGKNIPYHHLKENLENLDKIPYLIVCEHGNKSVKALKMMQQAGFSVQHLKGGVSTFFDKEIII